MKICQFNFNNEVDTFEIHVDEETGRVTIPGEDNTVMAEYESVAQLAENYALARDVKPENLKNWVLLEHGSVYSFVLRAGTAGATVAESLDQLDTIFADLSTAGQHHPLNIARARDQIMANGDAEMIDALVHCTETEIAREIYDAMAAAHETVPETAPETAPEERTALQKYVDQLEQVPGALRFLSIVTDLPYDRDKDALITALENSIAFSNADSLRALYENAIRDAMTNGIGVKTVSDALTVITQTVAAEKDDDMKGCLIMAARLARRDKFNVTTDIVGRHHIRHTAELMTLDEFEDLDIYVRDGKPFVVRFDANIDAELEAERDAAEAETDDTEVTENWYDPRDDRYDDGYDDEDDEDDEEDDDEDDDEEDLPLF